MRLLARAAAGTGAHCCCRCMLLLLAYIAALLGTVRGGWHASVPLPALACRMHARLRRSAAARVPTARGHVSLRTSMVLWMACRWAAAVEQRCGVCWCCSLWGCRGHRQAPACTAGCQHCHSMHAALLASAEERGSAGVAVRPTPCRTPAHAPLQPVLPSPYMSGCGSWPRQQPSDASALTTAAATAAALRQPAPLRQTAFWLQAEQLAAAS